MVERPPASSGGTRPARPGALPASESHQHTARIALHGRSQLPGWLWGVMGCLTVLGIGFAALFVIMKPADAPTTPPTAIMAAPVAPSAPAAAPAPRAPGIQVEQMAAPPATAPAPPRPKAPPRVVKVARSPSGARTAGEAAEEGGAAAEASDDDEAPKPKTAARETRERTPAAATEEADER
jgi:hypothetical protein